VAVGGVEPFRVEQPAALSPVCRLLGDGGMAVHACFLVSGRVLRHADSAAAVAAGGVVTLALAFNKHMRII